MLKANQQHHVFEKVRISVQENVIVLFCIGYCIMDETLVGAEYFSNTLVAY
jgi:hypothetical protein